MSTQEDFEDILSKYDVKKLHGNPTMKSYKTLLEDLKIIDKRLKNNMFHQRHVRSMVSWC
jgi:hypothetical protein